MERSIGTGLNTFIGRLIVATFFGAVGYFLFTLASVAASFAKGW